MVFYPPDWVPKLPFDPPDDTPIHDFMFDEKHGRRPINKSLPTFVDGLSGKSYTPQHTRDRVEWLARALQKRLGWSIDTLPNKLGGELGGDERAVDPNKVVCLFTLNTIDTLTVSWAVQRLNGISSPASAAYSPSELTYQLESSKSKAIFTCLPLLSTAMEAAKKAGISQDKIFLLDLPTQFTQGMKAPRNFKSVVQLVDEGEKLPSLPPLRWKKGQGAQQIAFLCYSSGTSGLPKGVMISHRNVIANTLQLATFEVPLEKHMRKQKGPDINETILGLLPFSHIYGLIVLVHQNVYRGGKIVVLPKFEMKSYLQAIQDHKIELLYIVPPIIILMTKNKSTLDKYDLSSVTTVWTGAAPLGAETADDIIKLWPNWLVRQGYGMTESCTCVCSTPYDDVDFGSSGCIMPSFEARIVNEEGVDIEGYDQAGELLVKSPSVVLGYLNNDEATRETFQDGWLRTGDKALVRKSPKGNEHIWIVDRMKELIKVKGNQVAPAELEAHLLTHPAVSDAAVIPIPDDVAGELPKAYVVKSPSVGLEDNDRMIKRDIQKHVEDHKARHKWLKGGVEFIDVIPKSASGKILRRMLRDKDKDERRKAGAKL